MAGPIPNLTPGYNNSNASANKCAEECHKVDLPSGSLKVKSVNVASVSMGNVASFTLPLSFAESTFRANPSLILCATSRGVIPFLYSLTEPSGNVIFIIYV
jgi:hypothetical protein